MNPLPHAPTLLQVRRSLYLIVAAVYLLPAGLLAESRTWTRNDGKTVKAELLKVSGSTATFELANGSQFEIEPVELSLADQAYIAKWQAMPENKSDSPNISTPSSSAADAAKKGHFVTMWASTDTEPYSGSAGLVLALEFNEDDNAIVPLNLRRFKAGTTNVYRDIKLPVPPDEVEKVRLIVQSGKDKWKASTVDFQFTSGNTRSDRISFTANRWLSSDRREGEQHRCLHFVRESRHEAF